MVGLGGCRCEGEVVKDLTERNREKCFRCRIAGITSQEVWQAWDGKQWKMPGGKLGQIATTVQWYASLAHLVPASHPDSGKLFLLERRSGPGGRPGCRARTLAQPLSLSLSLSRCWLILRPPLFLIALEPCSARLPSS